MTAPTTERTLPRLKQRYREEIAPALRDEFQIKNVMQTPKSGQDRGQYGCR